MKALTFHGKHDIRCERVTDPGLEHDRDAVVRLNCGAICGSDLHVYHALEQGLDHGTVMGHEFTGEIVALGKAVQGLAVGDRVVSPFTTNCGDCYYCRIGLTCRCSQGHLFGWVEGGAGLHGAQAEYVRVPLADSSLIKLPEDLDDETGLFLGDILATGYFAADNAGNLAGSTVAVIGSGPVGLMACLAAQELGAERVYAFDLVPERLALAQSFGALPLNAGKDEDIAQLLEATDGRGADAVLEAVGNASATRLAYRLVRPGGTLSVAGVHTEPHLAFSPAQAYDKNLTYKVGRCPARHYMERLIPLARTHGPLLKSIISHRMGLEQGAHGYKIFADKEEHCTKVILTP